MFSFLFQAGLILMNTGLAATPTMEERAQKALETHLQITKPLEKAANLAWWDANVSGKDEDFKRKEEAQNVWDEKLSDPVFFKELKEVRDGLTKKAPEELRRQIEVVYLARLEKQVPADLLKKMTSKANAIEQAFNNFRAKVGTQELADSQVKKVLKDSLDSKERQAAWEASKVVGAVVQKDLQELVALRNEAAKILGFKNYHAMQLFLNEQDPEKVLKLFDELDTLTRAPFLKAKGQIDRKLAERYKIPVNELRPWHYHDPFFQDAPSVFDADLDKVYASLDVIKLSREFYSGIGLPIDDVLSRSDLYERKGKSPHAFCTDIDREGDVRVLANVVANEAWMGTMLHELGHSVYSKNLPRTLPYPVRIESHILTTEGVAMLFQKFSKSADWLKGMGVHVVDPVAFNKAGRQLQKTELLVFSRWAQVMFRFEKALYENPTQNLNDLWWQLVEKYQGLKKPTERSAPDYGAKVHIVVAPAYYHNYLMGQLFASQVHHTVVKEVLHQKDPKTAQYFGNKKVGEYFQAKVFGPGRRMKWDELTRFATGQPLNAKAFAADLSD